MDVVCYCQVKLDLCPSGLSCRSRSNDNGFQVLLPLKKNVYLELEEWRMLISKSWDPGVPGPLDSSVRGAQRPSSRTQYFSSLTKNKFTVSNT